MKDWLVRVVYFFFFKQKTAYEMRISDWSSDVCSSDLKGSRRREVSRSTLASILTPFSPAGSRLTVADHRTAAAHAPGILPTDSPPSTGTTSTKSSAST